MGVSAAARVISGRHHFRFFQQANCDLGRSELMATPSSIGRVRSTRARRTDRSRRTVRARTCEPLAKAGFIARGVVYILIGVLALAIAAGKPAPEADRTGALQAV